MREAGRLLSIVVPVAIIGAAMAALAAYGPVFGHVHPLWSWIRDAPSSGGWLWMLTVVALLAGSIMAIAQVDRLFRYRYQVAVVLLVGPPTMNGVNVGKLDAFELGLMVVTLFWLAAALVESRPVLTPRIVLAFLLGVLACAVGSFSVAGLGGMFAMPGLVTKLALVFLATNLISTFTLHRMALRTLMILGVAASLLAIGSEVLYMSTGRILTSIDEQRELFKATPLGQMFRVSGLNPTPQIFGNMMVFMIAVTLLVPMSAITRLISCALMVLALLLTFSAGAILSAAAVFAMWPFFRWPAQAIQLAMGYTAMAVMAHVTGLVGLVQDDIIMPFGGEGAGLRLEFLRKGVAAIQEHPWVGVGLGGYGRVDPTFPIHSAYFQLAAEIGVLGAVLFAGLIVYLLMACGIRMLAETDPERRPWIKAQVLGLIGVAGHCMVEPFSIAVFPWTVIALAAAALVAYAQPSRHLPLTHHPHRHARRFQADTMDGREG